MPTILIAGVSGLVGFAAAKHFARLPGWKVIAVSRRKPEGLDGVELISVDLTDRARSTEVFGRMRDVTHLVYAALYEKPGLVAGDLRRVARQSHERDPRDRRLRGAPQGGGPPAVVPRRPVVGEGGRRRGPARARVRVGGHVTRVRERDLQHQTTATSSNGARSGPA